MIHSMKDYFIYIFSSYIIVIVSMIVNVVILYINYKRLTSFNKK